MAINIGTNFAYHGKLPNFDRDQFKTKAEMKAFDENSINEGHLSYCAEDGNTYQFKSSNTVDATTGRWRLFKTEADAVLNGTSINPIQNKAVFDALKLKADAVALGAYQPKYKADYIAKADFNYSDLPASTNVVDLNGYTMSINKNVTISDKNFYNGNIELLGDGVAINDSNFFRVDFNEATYYITCNNVLCELCNLWKIKFTGGIYLYYCSISYMTIESATNVDIQCTEIIHTSIGSNITISPAKTKIYYSNIQRKKINNGVITNGEVIEVGFESNIITPTISGNAPSCEAVKDALQLKADKTQLKGLATKTELNSKADASELDNYTTTATTNAISADVTSLMNEVFVLTATASVSPNIAEVGTNPTVTLTVDAKLGKGRTQVDEITIDGTKYTGEIPYTHSATATTTHTYNITVKKGTKTANASATINFYNASYYGVVDASKTSLTATEVKTLKTKEVKSGRSGTRTFNLTNQKACIAYPKSFGAAASIKDANGFDYLASYTRNEVTIDSVVYYVYLLSSPTTITDFKQIIS